MSSWIEKVMTESDNRRLDIYCVIFLGTLVLVFFGRVIYSGQTLFGSDFVLYFYSVKKFVREYVLTNGTLPLWNPFQFSGTPFISNIQASMFYPMGLLFYVMPTETAYVWTVVIHCIFGSIFMYLFARTLSTNRAGSLLAAVIFTFNGYFMAHLYAGHLSFVQTYIWIPLIFFFVLQFINTLQCKQAVLAGLCLGIQILGGFPQIAFYTILATVAFGFFRMAMALRVKAVSMVKQTGIGLAVILAVGFSLAAIQLLPTLQFTELSGRAGGVGYWFATLDSLHPKQFVSFFIPDFFGNASDGTYWLSPKDWHFWETCGYVGILGLSLLFVPAPHKSSSLRNTRFFFVGVVVASLFLALGKYNPIYPLIYKFPGFHSFRIPAQILFLFVFGTSVLSAIGLHRLEESCSKLPKGLVLFLAVGCLGFLFLLVVIHKSTYSFFYALFRAFGEQPVDSATVQEIPDKIYSAIYRSSLLFFSVASLFIFLRKRLINRTLFKVIVLAIVMVDLGSYASQFVKPYQLSVSEEKQKIAGQLNRNKDVERILIVNKLFLDNDGSLYRFRTINGYDPLVLGRYILFLQASQNLPLVKEVITTDFLRRYDHKFLKMLNVTHVLGDQGITKVNPGLPKAVLVNRAVLKPTEEVLDFMKSDSFDPFSSVVFEPENASFVWPVTTGERFHGNCFITEYGDKAIRIKSSANQPCYLVLTEMYYPGWQATVNGQPAEVLRGDYLFRVIPLDRGEHDVEMRFVCRPFQAGAIISVLTLLGSTAFLLVMKKRAKST